MVGSQDDLEQLCNWPRDDPLPSCPRRRFRKRDVSDDDPNMRGETHHSPKQHMNDRGHLGTDPEAVARTNGLGDDLCEPKGEDCQSL